MTREAVTSAPVITEVATRWSPRSFNDEHSFQEGALRGVFEAARWAASASNTQPWRFVLGLRGTETFAKIDAALMGFNRAWAGRAAALVVNIAETESADGAAQRWAEYDLGQAVASYTLQARSEGYFVHQMGGIEVEQLREAFGLEARQVPVSVAAIGLLDSAEKLPEKLKLREEAPRVRLPLEQLFLVRDLG